MYTYFKRIMDVVLSGIALLVLRRCSCRSPLR
jgi:lipopolysaccharide/colanic/teichoic acid biosynthesis glycosyltransferase